MTKFAIGSKVIIQNLVTSSHYNGMKGTVKSDIDPMTLRQAVYLIEAEKEIAVKPANLREEEEFVANGNGSTRVPTKCGECGSTENLKNCAKVRGDDFICAYDDMRH